MNKHTKLLSAKFSPGFTQKDAQELWQEVSNILNSCVGARKDWKSWRKTWQDIRCRTKSKSSTLNRQHTATGGGPYIKNPITNYENLVLETIAVVEIEGHTNVKESETTFKFSKDTVECNDPVIINYPETPTCSNNILIENIEAPTEKRAEMDIPQSKKSFPRKKLIYASQATQDYKVSLDNKNQIKSKYYEKKIVVSERIACAMERIAEAKEREVEVQKNIAISKQKSAEAKEAIAQNIGVLAQAVQSLHESLC